LKKRRKEDKIGSRFNERGKGRKKVRIDVNNC
jgi:hypothetical protein